MPGIRLSGPVHWGRRRIAISIALIAIIAIASTVFLSRPVAASEQYGLQTINVRMSTDTSVRGITTASVTKDDDGRVSETVTELDPAESLAALPVRVQTAWWHDGATGTDLADLDGASGRIVLRVSVQDLTAEPTELSFETGGARYRQQALVGVPLTVVASARIGSGDRVVQVDDGASEESRVTDGMLVETTDDGRSVQWAAYLAPPMLSPTADFTLVIDSARFTVPAFDLTIQPGLVTDPSVSALVDRAFGADGYSANLESSTIELVQNVNSRLTEALDFIDQVHLALEQDVAQLGEQSYRELSQSSQTVLGHLASTASVLESIRATGESGIAGVGSQTHSGVSALARSLDGVLGSTAFSPRLTSTTIEGCTATMPVLAEGQARTVASTVYLADAQLQAIAGLFDDGVTDNCRTALHDLVRGTIGEQVDTTDPAAVDACRNTPEGERTVACVLALARVVLSSDFAALSRAADEVHDAHRQLQVSDLTGALGGTDGLAATLTDLRDRLDTAHADAGSVSSNLSAWTQDTSAEIDRAQQQVATMRAELGKLRTALTALRTARDSAHAALFDQDGASVRSRLTAISAATDGPPSVGEWFVDSQYAQAMTTVLTSVSGACPATWADGLDQSSSVQQIVAALDQLDVAGCPVQQLAVASRDLVLGYDDTVQAVGVAGGEAAAAGTTLDAVEQSFADLDAAIADLDQIVTASGALETALTALDDPATGALTTLESLVDDLAPHSSSGLALAQLGDDLGDMVSLVGGLWPDDSVQPLTGTTGCPQQGGRPTATAQEVVWLGNRLLCTEAELGTRIVNLGTRLSGTQSGTDGRLQDAANRTQDAMDRAGQEIDRLSAGLVTDLNTQREAGTEAALALIDQSRADMQAQIDQILATYDLMSSQVLSELSSSMQQSATESTAVAQSLTQDFAVLLANLGSPDPTSRGGMLGKLHGITAQVGETGTVLDSVGSTTTAYGNIRSGELRDIDLRSAQFAAAEERRAQYRPFAEVDDDLETVFVFQIRGEQ